LVVKISVELWRMRNEPGLIHLVSSDGKTFHAEVTNVEGRIGYYPYLFVKLERMLEAAGEAAGEAPAPPKTPGWLPRVMRGKMPITCSFCGRTEGAVRKMIAGPSAYICDECVDLCNEIFESDESLPDWRWRAVEPGG
jgi:hypothetical protein